MSKVKFFNEDCMTTMNNMLEFNQKIDLILTSPPTTQVDHPQVNVAVTTWKEDMMFIQTQ